jgi:hypothetical protein
VIDELSAKKDRLLARLVPAYPEVEGVGIYLGGNREPHLVVVLTSRPESPTFDEYDGTGVIWKIKGSPFAL